MKLQQVQADIIPFVQYVSDEFGGKHQQQILFDTDLPDLTMDFVPVLLHHVLQDVYKTILKDALPGEEITVSVAQQFPSYLSIIIRFLGMGYVEADKYRELLKTVEGELTLSVSSQKQACIQIDLPIYNRSGYWEVSKVIKLLNPGPK